MTLIPIVRVHLDQHGGVAATVETEDRVTQSVCVPLREGEAIQPGTFYSGWNARLGEVARIYRPFTKASKGA